MKTVKRNEHDYIVDTVTAAVTIASTTTTAVYFNSLLFKK